MLALALAVVLDCKPVEFHPFTARGTTKRQLTLDVTKKGMTLKEKGAVLWTTEQYFFAVMIAEDDSWVAAKGPYPIGSIFIAAAAPGAKPVLVDPMQHLSEDEKKRVPETSCGTSWFGGWKNTPKVLELTVNQGQDAPALTLRVKPDGSVSR